MTRAITGGPLAALAAILVMVGCEQTSPVPADPKPPDDPADPEGPVEPTEPEPTGSLFPESETFTPITEYETVTLSAEEGPVVVAKNEIMVFLDSEATSQDHDDLADRIASLGGEVIGGIRALKTVQVRVPDSEDELEFAIALADLPAFGLGGYHFTRELADASSEANLPDPDFPGDYWVEQIGASSAWKYTQGSDNTRAVIGVLDTGIPAFGDDGPFGPGRLTRYTNDGMAVVGDLLYPDPRFAFHGATVACLAAARLHNDWAGVAHKNRIVAVDAFTHNLATKSASHENGELYNAFYHAATRGADIINISLEPENIRTQENYWRDRIGYLPVIRAAADPDWDIIVVIAAGNSGFKADDHLFPRTMSELRRAGYTGDEKVFDVFDDADPLEVLARAEALWNSNVLIVADVGPGGEEASTSVMGNVVNIAAPGTGVGCGLHEHVPQWPMTVDGTSHAAPLVAGTAALIRSVKSGYSASDVREIILEHASEDVQLRGGTHPTIQLDACWAVASVVEEDFVRGDTWPSFGSRTVEDVEYLVGEEIEPLELPEAICHRDGLVYTLVTEHGEEVPGLTLQQGPYTDDLRLRDTDDLRLEGTPTEAGVYRMEYVVKDPRREGEDTVRKDNPIEFTITVQGACEDDPKTLLAMKDQLRGTGTLNWDSDVPIDSWDGVNRSSGSFNWPLGCVISLHLYDRQLTGSIPDAIGNLFYLQKLRMFDNQLTGSIPESIGNLSNLNTLVLSNNQLTGSIPESIGNLSNLGRLDLYDNQLTGSIPESIGNLSNLRYLMLNNNQLTGSIPESIGNLSNLEYLRMFDNQLTGSIPESIGNLSNLRYLALGTLFSPWVDIWEPEPEPLGNNLTGSIPESIGNLSNLRILYLNNNQLTGSIPESIGNLSNLNTLVLSNNQLTGNIPESIGNLSNLNDQLRLSNNQLTGSIPESIGNLSKVDVLLLDENNLTGSIPEAIVGIVDDVRYNYLTGCVPTNRGVFLLRRVNPQGREPNLYYLAVCES